jgi:hypothetical protein
MLHKDVLRGTSLIMRLLLGALFFVCAVFGRAHADYTIEVIPGSSQSRGKAYQYASAQVSIENDDLFNMPFISMKGIDDRDGESVFEKNRVGLRTLDDGRKETVWHGSLSSSSSWFNIFDKSSLFNIFDKKRTRVGFATFIQSPTGAFSGTFNNENTAYSLIQFADGTHQIRSTKWEDFLPEADALESSSTNTTVTPPQAVIRKALSVVPDMSGTYVYSGTGPFVSQSDFGNRHLREDAEARRLLVTKDIADVLVIITNRAMCEFAGRSKGCALTESNAEPIMNQIPILELDTNNAMLASGATNVAIRIVEYIFLDADDYDAKPNVEALNVISDNPTIAQWREDAGADLVSIIGAATESGCGIAYLNSFESVVGHECLDYYSFTHELGHNFGCLHNREVQSSNHDYAYGWHYENTYRSVMAYNCDNGCPRVPFFSNDEYQYDGYPMGDSKNDNARLLEITVPDVAGWVTATKSPQTPTPPATTPQTPTSPSPITTSPTTSPPTTERPTYTQSPTYPMTCPSSPFCPGANLMGKRRLLFLGLCVTSCVPESGVELHIMRRWQCGGTC